MKLLYAYRGWILGALAIALVLCNPSPVSQSMVLLKNFPGELLAQLIVFAVLLLLSCLLRIQARRTIGEHTRGFTHDADRLVTEGVYSKIRHPLYLSNTGVGLAFIDLHLGFSWQALPFAIVLIAFEVLLSRLEDRYLENRFGDVWRKWAAETNAFVPRIACRNDTAAHMNPEKGCGKPAAHLNSEAAGERIAGRLDPEKGCGKPAERLRSDAVDMWSPRSFLAAARADFSTWIWLTVAIVIIILRKTVLTFNLLELVS